MLIDERRKESLTFIASICKKQKSQKLFAAPEDMCVYNTFLRIMSAALFLIVFSNLRVTLT